jgi:hypothetical protein
MKKRINYSGYFENPINWIGKEIEIANGPLPVSAPGA